MDAGSIPNLAIELASRMLVDTLDPSRIQTWPVGAQVGIMMREM